MAHSTLVLNNNSKKQKTKNTIFLHLGRSSQKLSGSRVASHGCAITWITVAQPPRCFCWWRFKNVSSGASAWGPATQSNTTQYRKNSSWHLIRAWLLFSRRPFFWRLLNPCLQVDSKSNFNLSECFSAVWFPVALHSQQGQNIKGHDTKY